MLSAKQDAFGRVIWETYKGKSPSLIVERDDGLVEDAGPISYFADYRDWPERHREAMKLARGRVLDIGCGAGRHALYLQGKGLDVIGIDNSPLAVKVCRLRGLKRAKLMSVTQISSKLGLIDMVLMMGNNFGLFENVRRARWLLKRLDRITSERARIIAESRDPHDTSNPEHLAYHRRNIRRGRMPGQVRIRVRHRTYATPWFDYLMVSGDEMKGLLQGTAWEVKKFIDESDSMYIGIIGKRDA